MSSAAPPVRIGGYSWPQGRVLRGYVATLAMWALSGRRALTAPGSFAHEAFLATRPRAQAWAPRIQDGVFYFLAGAHVVEVLFIAVPRLRKHRVPVFSAAWCQWVLAWLVAGAYAMLHFDAVVEAETAKKAQGAKKK